MAAVINRCISTTGHERMRSAPTKAEAAEMGKGLRCAQNMTPLRAAGRFFRYWFLAEVIRWNESTLTLRYLCKEDQDETYEFEIPSDFQIPGLISADWAAAHLEQRWIVRRPCGDLVDATIVGIDRDYAVIKRHDRGGRSVLLHVPSSVAVCPGGHPTRTILLSHAVRPFQKPSGRCVGNRLVSTISKAVCDTCGWSEYGQDREDARSRARKHRFEVADVHS